MSEVLVFLPLVPVILATVLSYRKRELGRGLGIFCFVVFIFLLGLGIVAILSADRLPTFFILFDRYIFVFSLLVLLGVVIDWLLEDFSLKNSQNWTIYFLALAFILALFFYAELSSLVYFLLLFFCACLLSTSAFSKNRFASLVCLIFIGILALWSFGFGAKLQTTSEGLVSFLQSSLQDLETAEQALIGVSLILFFTLFCGLIKAFSKDYQDEVILLVDLILLLFAYVWSKYLSLGFFAFSDKPQSLMLCKLALLACLAYHAISQRGHLSGVAFSLVLLLQLEYVEVALLLPSFIWLQVVVLLVLPLFWKKQRQNIASISGWLLLPSPLSFGWICLLLIWLSKGSALLALLLASIIFMQQSLNYWRGNTALCQPSLLWTVSLLASLGFLLSPLMQQVYTQPLLDLLGFYS